MNENLGNIFEQVQKNMQDMQSKVASIEVTGEAGAGLVKVTMTAQHQVKRVFIDPSLLGDDKDMLEDLVAAAFNQASRNIQQTMQEQMGGLAGGMPAGFDLSSIFGGK